MAKKKDVYKVKPMTEGKRNIIQQLISEYNIETAKDIRDALKDQLGGTIQDMLETEMDEHLGYQKYARSDSDNARNGTKSKKIVSSYGTMNIDVPQDRYSSFEPKIVQKRKKNISDIEGKIIVMYSKGLSTTQISEMINDLYGFEVSESFIDTVRPPLLKRWAGRIATQYCSPMHPGAGRIAAQYCSPMHPGAGRIAAQYCSPMHPGVGRIAAQYCSPMQPRYLLLFPFGVQECTRKK